MKNKFWVDFENAPHIPVLLPIVRKLEEAGYEPVMTARKFSFTEELVKKYNLPAKLVGKGGGVKSSFGKAFQLARRVIQLAYLISPQRKSIAFSIAHASRSQLFTSYLLGITSVSLEDYEHSNQLHNRLSSYLLIPEPIPVESFPKNRGKVIHYPGIKENIYLEGLELPRKKPEFIQAIQNKVIVLFRPEGRTAHYRSAQSQALQQTILEKLKQNDSAHILIYPRDTVQKNEMADFLLNGKAEYSFPPVTDGPDLIASVDLIVGGGGTMTREAAVLGIPSYSFFSGKWGGVDVFLTDKGDLIRIEKADDIGKISITRRKSPVRIPDLKTTDFIVSILLGIGADQDSI